MLKNFFQFFFRRLKIAYRKSFNTKYINLHGIKIKLSHEFISKDIKHLFYMDAYENNEIEILKKILTKNDTVMELGSGIGFISSYCSKVIGSEKVFTFEANPKLISEIKDTYLQNNVNPTIKNVILSNHDGFEDFFVEKTFYSSSQIKRNNTIEKIKIKCSDINFEIQNINPSLLIIDIEGGEKNTIPLINFKKNNIKKILIEFHPELIGNDISSSLISFIISQDFSLKLEYIRNSVLLFEKNV